MPNPNPSPGTRFQKGNSLGGRTKGSLSMTTRLKILLEKNEYNGKKIKDGKTVADLIVEMLTRKALRGEQRSIEYLMDRIDGKIVEKLQELTANVEEMSDDQLRDLARPKSKGRARTKKT